MATVKGKVKAVARTGKGVTFDGDTWYNSGQPVFKPELRGQTISFSVNEKNFIEGRYTVDESAPSSGGGQKAKKPFIDNSIGMGVGMAMNNAILLSIEENKGYDEDYVRATAVKIYTLAEELKQQAAAGSFKAVTETTKAIEDLDDDDNPFL